MGSRAGKRSDGEKNHREAELIRCCDGFITLPHPFSSSLPVCFSLSVGCHALQLKQIHHSFTFNLSSVGFCSCVTLDDKGVESKCPSHYVFLYNLFLSVWLFMSEYGFFLLPLIQPCIFLFLCLYLSFPDDVKAEVGGGYDVYSVRSRGVQWSDYSTK